MGVIAAGCGVAAVSLEILESVSVYVQKEGAYKYLKCAFLSFRIFIYYNMYVNNWIVQY